MSVSERDDVRGGADEESEGEECGRWTGRGTDSGTSDDVSRTLLSTIAVSLRAWWQTGWDTPLSPLPVAIVENFFNDCFTMFLIELISRKMVSRAAILLHFEKLCVRDRRFNVIWNCG